MEVNGKRMLFNSHMCKLEKSIVPGHQKRVDDYVNRYEKGERAWIRHPIIAAQRVLIEHTSRPSRGDFVEGLDFITTEDKQLAYARLRVSRAFGKVLGTGTVAVATIAIGTVTDSTVLMTVAVISIMAWINANDTYLDRMRKVRD